MRDDDPVAMQPGEKKMETLDIPQVIAEISRFFDVYGTLMKEASLIFIVLAVSAVIKMKPAETHPQDDNQAPFS